MQLLSENRRAPFTEDEIRQAFRDNGLRFTRQRASIYRALISTRSHPTAEELFAAVRDEQPQVSLATIYNTLDALTGAGLCRRLPGATASGACRYDADTTAHAHLIADSGEILDVPDDLSDRLVQSLPSDVIAEMERRFGVAVKRVELHLFASTSR